MFFRRKKKAPQPGAGQAPGQTPGIRPQATGATGGAAGATAEEAATQFLTGDGLVDQRTVRVLLDAIARVNESRDLEELLDYIVDTSIEVTGAERGMLIFQSPGTDQLRVRVARQRGKEPLREEARFSTSVVHRVLTDQEPLRSIDSTAEAMQLGTSVFDLKLRAMMCVPLSKATAKATAEAGGDEEKGVLYVDSKVATREFQDEDFALFEALSQHVSVALENATLHLHSIEKARLERSLEIASEIQGGLMPQVPSDLHGLDVHGWYRSAEKTSGDFYDFVRTRSGKLAVVVGDVTGHGIGPALITATAQASLRSYLRILEDPGEALTMLNQDLSERLDDGLFLTLFLAIVGEDGTVHALNAGHTPPLVWRAATGEIETIRGHGPALGMMEDFKFEEHSTLQLEPGDYLVAFTDGLSEARSLEEPDVMFDEEGVRKTLQECAAESRDAVALTEEIVTRALSFAQGNREDDMTLVCLRRTVE